MIPPQLIALIEAQPRYCPPPDTAEVTERWQHWGLPWTASSRRST